jgi:hypothetical protein
MTEILRTSEEEEIRQTFIQDLRKVKKFFILKYWIFSFEG